MSKLTIVVFSLLGLISACVGQELQEVLQLGQCNDDNVAVVQNFEAARYLGVWYDIESLPSPFQSGTCNTANYAVTGATLSIENTQVNEDGFLESAIGTATSVAGEPAKLNVVIGTNSPVPYWILDTDYTTFALVYSCREEGIYRRVNSWKLGRAKGPLPDAATTRINERIPQVPALSAAAHLYVQRDHSAFNCSYFVERDGTCSTTLAGAANFNASEFQGTWYESARYRQESQTGQCNRAEYAADANGIVTVRNSQVITQALNTISGVAFAVTGRPGVLQVNFNVNGVLRSQNLVVLATDNNNYALLYSCQQVAANRRRISSWQLRKRLAPLDDEYITAINNIINTNDDLEQAPYVETSQTYASCFYYPEWTTLPATIDLSGPCDESITGASNFNAATFLGTWHEIARYPSPTQTGQCNRAVYGPVTGGNIAVRNSQVNQETLNTILGTATAVAGQTGVLDVTLTTSSGDLTQRLYVLATDNTNYALLYSCQNIISGVETRRRVGSWKLRKQSGALSAEANATINSVIAATEGLKESYYLPETSQTDAACFYYPDWAVLPATIELPGPCNTSITGVVGFDASRFLGTWYEVGRYPQPTQAGQCNRAVYGPITGNVVAVQNRQVNNETLSTISGTAATVTGQPGVLEVTLATSSGDRTQRLVVLDTDYDNYALLYTCDTIVVEEETRRRVGSWQLTKNLGPLNAESNVAISTTIAATQGLRQDYYQTTSQSDSSCFYYPEWETLPTTIELPGPCNTTITGTTTFNAQTFVGIWNEIERYPQTTQGGQCNRAEYGLGTGGVINVQNSQVTGQTLSTIPGTATAVAGQTGVLNVTLTTSSGPVSQMLYVLATDNTNYALLYSCQNIVASGVETRRRVGSWRLSKQLDPLSETANATMDTVITNTQGLRRNYYQTTRQDAGACFYYPATQAEEKVVIPGQCDATLLGQASINMTRFANGTWYHIRRYDQVGNRSCIATRLSYETSDDGNSVIVNSVELAGGVENRTEGRAQLIAAANGQFSLTWSGSNDSTTITVIGTDYDAYAIAYTCENSGANRQVGVWLLSRGRTWPAAGVTALATLVAAREEFTLREGYFKDIPHNNDCPEPSSAFLFKSSIIVIFVCTVLQFVW